MMLNAYDRIIGHSWIEINIYMFHATTNYNLVSKIKFRTCRNDQRLLEPVNIGWGISSDDTPHFVILVQTGVLDAGSVLPRDPD